MLKPNFTITKTCTDYEGFLNLGEFFLRNGNKLEKNPKLRLCIRAVKQRFVLFSNNLLKVISTCNYVLINTWEF